MEQLPDQQRRSRGLPDADQDRGVSATNDAHESEVQIQNVHQVPQTTGDVSGDDVIKTVLFQNHLGKTYIWPLELCHSLETVKYLIQEAYTHDAWHLEQIKDEQYDIENEDGAVILPSVWKNFLKPSTKVRISFQKEDVPRRMPLSIHPSTRGSTNVSDVEDEDEPENTKPERMSKYLESVYSDKSRYAPPPPPVRVLSISLSESEDDDDDDDENELSIEAEDVKISRRVVPAVDDKGNRLSFGVDTSRARNRLYVQRELGDKEEDSEISKHRQETIEQSLRELKITKAMLSGTDAKTSIQVHILPGPNNAQLRGNVRTTWYHLQAAQLDLARFKETCVEIEGLTSRLQMLTREVFDRVEKYKAKKFLSGYFIEPGTVVRADEKRQDKPEAVVFSCIPHLALQTMSKQPPVSSGTKPSLFPSRTLMQAMYPLWLVQDRDKEQAYRKFGNEQTDKVVHVSDMWVMNIGADIVVTHGHRALTDEMVNSIEVVKEDLRQLGSDDITKNSLTTVRITHRDNRVRLYSLDACRSYFQLESKLNLMKTVSCRSKNVDDLRVIYSFMEGRRVVAPKDWTAIVKRTDLMFIDVEEIEQDEASSTEKDLKLDVPIHVSSSVLPFFRWPSTTSDTSIVHETDPQSTPTTDKSREAHRLEYAEKIMLNEDLDSFRNAVEETFASTRFYRSIPEITHKHVGTRFQSLPEDMGDGSQDMGDGNDLSFHATVIAEQRLCVIEKSHTFYKIAEETLRLFVSDLDGSPMLRKLWSTMINIFEWVEKVRKLDAAAPGPAEAADVDAYGRRASTTGWFIRNGKLRSIALPNAGKEFKRSLRHCRRCTSSRPFESANGAIEHLQSHLEPQMPGTHDDDFPSGHTDSQPSTVGDGLNLSDWVVEAMQLEQEKSNAGGVQILTQTCEDALKLFQQIKELADGIRNEDEEPSDLYTFPRHLVGAFRKLSVFYIGVERALWYTRGSDLDKESRYVSPRYSSCVETLRTLKRFAKGVETSVSLARNQLCDMVKPDPTPDSLQNLSLGSEYICAWFMRRLLVKPLELGLSAGDMYRKYLTDIQLQVSQHPGKRVIRSINLLQEELRALDEVNRWQDKVVKNYRNVLNDKSYENDIPSRSAMFPFERDLLQSCEDYLNTAHEEYQDMIERCIPLSNQAKQSLEIYEEDHGKAITAFTVVTVIFLPLSFVTSYLGMNTVDIRDMTSGQGLFWAIALPLTFITIGATMLIGYNGDVLRDSISDLYHKVIGTQDRNTYARGSKLARSRRTRLQNDSRSDFSTSMADDAEYMKPQSVWTQDMGEDDYTPYGDELGGHVVYETATRRVQRRDYYTDEGMGEYTWTRRNTDRRTRHVGHRI